MASVFLSYDRDDAAMAGTVARALEKAGHKVWWDRHIKGGAQYSKEIEQALADADAVVVLWSEQSVNSAWVRDEAANGRDRGVLVPISIGGFEPPLGFRQYQTIDLARGRLGRAGQRSLLAAVAAASASPVAVKKSRPPRRAFQFSRSVWMTAAIAAILAIAAVGLVALKPWANRDEMVLSVGPSGSGTDSRALARDLLVKLGSLRSAKAGSLRLVESRSESPAAANFLFQVGAGQGDRAASATLVLMDGRSRSLLWSKEFVPANSNPADLKQQLAYTAARVLDCAVESFNAGGKQLDQQTRTLYLNGCAKLSELIGSDPSEVLPIFLEVVERAPSFAPAWSNLLLTEANRASRADPAGTARLRAHIASARKLDPAMAEAVLAEASLLPNTALAEQTRMIDRAIATRPDNANLLEARSGLRGLLGRWRNAIADARLASELEPLSAAHRHSYILSLAYGGKTEAAFRELDKGERLWPGASNMTDARFRLHLRYGDPKEALRLIRAGLAQASASTEIVLTAKTDPTSANVERAKMTIRNAVERYPNQATGPLQAYPEFGMEDELFGLFERWPRIEPATLSVLFRPAFRGLHRDPRFLHLAARSGMVAIWQDTGKWPDFCFEPDLPYDCAAEAAKLNRRSP